MAHPEPADTGNRSIIRTNSPVDESLIAEYSEHTENQIDDILGKTQKAFEGWRFEDFPRRAEHMKKAASVLNKRKQELTELMSVEMGKVYKEGRSEIEKCAWVCEYYAENAEKFLADQTVKTDHARSFVTFQPIGAILAVMPWNFPFWQVFRFAAPNLMAGNAALLKHASNVSGCALAIESIFREAGFPEHLFRSLIIKSDKVERVISDPRTRAVTLTGSTQAGRKVASAAGKHLKKTVMELGGSDGYLILADADIKNAAKLCAQSRLINSGQSCIAAKRFIVEKPVYDDFLEAVTEEMRSKTLGDPANEATDIGPQAKLNLRDELHEQVRKSIAKGARCVLGGEIPDQKGAWYPATILADVPENSPAYKEELFGPVASVIQAKDEDHAIEISNGSVFGLGGGIFSRDLERATKIAREKLNTGAVAINDFVKSDPRLPFGGVKDSGYGRELSEFGIQEFVNIKSVTQK